MNPRVPLARMFVQYEIVRAKKYNLILATSMYKKIEKKLKKKLEKKIKFFFHFFFQFFSQFFFHFFFNLSTFNMYTRGIGVVTDLAGYGIFRWILSK